MGLFGGHQIPKTPTPTGPAKDTTIVATPPVKDTVIKVPPSNDTTVVVVTPTPPVVTPPPSGAYRTVIADSVAYNSTAELQARITSNIGGTGTGNVLYTDGVNGKLAEVDPSVKYRGHNTIKYNMPKGGSQPELWVRVPDMKHFWLRAKIRWSPGFTTTGNIAGSSNAYKMLGFGFNPGGISGMINDGSGRLEITNTTQYQLYFGTKRRSDNVTLAANDFAVSGNIVNEWTDGKFYDYIIEINLSDSVGVGRVWITADGQTPVLRGTSRTGITTKVWPGVNAINLGMNFNQNRQQDEAVWYGQWEVVDGDKYADPFQVK